MGMRGRFAGGDRKREERMITNEDENKNDPQSFPTKSMISSSS